MQDRLAPVNVLHARLTKMCSLAEVTILKILMNTTLRQKRIDFDLQEYKHACLDYCRAHGVTPSTALRPIGTKVANGGIPTEEQVTCAVASENAARGATGEEVATTSEIARGEGLSLTRWIAVLINAPLYARPQLDQR